MLNRKGFTLAEVVVALGILITGITLSTTLVLQILNFENIIRQQTEAMAYAEEFISKATTELLEDCGLKVLPEPNASCSNDYDENVCATIDGSSGDFHVEVKVLKDADFPEISGLDNPAEKISRDEFIMLRSTVTWNDKFNRNQSRQLEQYIKIP